MDQHELVSAVKNLALELGRTPTRPEFCSRIAGGEYKVKKFGGWTPLLRACGLETYDDRRCGNKEKITNSIFERSIEKHLEEYEPRPAVDRGPWPTMAVISDTHWPFVNKRVVDRFYEYVEQHKPEWVILNGDAWDMYSATKFPRSHNQFTPREERAAALKANTEFWQKIRALSPKSKCVQLLGNHDVRVLRRILEAVPAAEDWIEEAMRRDFAFEGVRTIFDPREELMVGPDIAVFHGFRSQLGANRDYTLMHVFVAHTHKGGTVARRIRGQTLIECNSGFAGDPEGKGLTYTPQKITDQTPGFSGCDEWGPRFVSV